MELTQIYRFHSPNLGDLYSNPARYFFPNSTVRKIDIMRKLQGTTFQGPVIVGGGGLLGWHRFQRNLRWLSRADVPVILWGIGHNSIVNKKKGYLRRPWIRYPGFLRRFSLVGLRDTPTPYRYVPCPSCMHPLFQKKRSVTRPFVVYRHAQIPFPALPYPSLTNECERLATVLDFLGSAETILTNSYHGAYWGLLLGRKVLAVPWSSKFYANPRITTVRHTTLLNTARLREAVAGCTASPTMLEEAIEQNLRFYEEVKQIV